jgi:hypothetical protein
MVSEMVTENFTSTNVHHTVVLHELPTGILVLCGLSRCLITSYPPRFFFIKKSFTEY